MNIEEEENDDNNKKPKMPPTQRQVEVRKEFSQKMKGARSIEWRKKISATKQRNKELNKYAYDPDAKSYKHKMMWKNIPFEERQKSTKHMRNVHNENAKLLREKNGTKTVDDLIEDGTITEELIREVFRKKD